jgi:ABC-type nitrate/sulfonate/bicarbonate transport system ATPase subunit
VAGLLTPTKGEILVDGQRVDGPGPDRGMVFQAYTSFGWMTVRDNVEYGLRLRGVPNTERRRLSDKYIASVGLTEFAGRYPKDLSGGMKQRVAIARTLINEPRVVLMDEPFGALDPQTRWGMQGLLLDVSREVDNTILFVTHDVSEAVYLADTIYVLSARPARILHKVDVPFFANRDIALKVGAGVPGGREAPSRPAVRAGGRNRVEYAHGSCGQARPARHRTVLPAPAGSRGPSRTASGDGGRRRVGARCHPREASVPEVRLQQSLQPLALRRRPGRGGPDDEPAARRGGDRRRGAVAAVRA